MRPRARRSKPTRCISARTCGPRSRCWWGSAAWRWATNGPTRPRPSSLLCVRVHRRLAARPPHHRHADRYGTGGLRRNRPARRWPCARRGRGRQRPGAAGRRQAGCRVVVAVSRTLPLDRVKALKERIAEAIRTEMPRAEVGVEAAPRALDDESVQERVMVIARNQALAVHHVTVHDIRGRRSVSLDLESTASLRSARPMTSPTSWRRRFATSSGPTSRSRPISNRCSPRRQPAARPLRNGCARSRSRSERSRPRAA